MRRRSFVKSSLLAGSLPVVIQASAKAAEKNVMKTGNRMYYELRTYLLSNETQRQTMETYWKNVAIPALNQMGSKPVGVFAELKPEDQSNMYVLIPYQRMEDFADSWGKLAKNDGYTKAAKALLETAQPPYSRIESSLLHAFAKFPDIKASAGKQRMFELRRYESPNEIAGKKKIEMFNDAGEIDIFLKTGLNPVFFGECMIGEYRPNLTYMLQFDGMNDHDAAWKAFGSSPEWNQLKSIPDYADAKIISKITSLFLMPAAYSQI